MADRSSPTATRPWYAEGLRFTCTQCGNCCTGPPGQVGLSAEEAHRIAKRLGLEVEAFYRRFAHRVDGRWSLVEHKTDHGYDCVFLDRRTNPGRAICSIYEARPAQCRTWPFWPQNLTSRRAWTAVRRRTPCPGMDNGRLIRPEQIRILRDATSK